MTAKIIPLPVSFPQVRISVVMVSFHTGAALFESVQSVLADPDIFEVILVDNGNPVPTRNRLWNTAKNENRFRLLQGHGNVGFGRGCNYGAKIAKGDYLLFLNPDAVIEKGAAMKLVRCGEKLKCPWIVGGHLQTIDGREQRGSRRNELTPLSALISFTPVHKFTKLQSIHLENNPLPDIPSAVPIVSGACMMMDRESFGELGGFDESYFLHVEDIDICRRARSSGGQVFTVPNARTMHYGSTSQVRIQKVEYEKFKGFVRYFWNYSQKWWAKLALICATPFMFLAIMGRAWWIALRSVWRG
jgi:GT2 family glycosyltransferase